MNNTLHDKSIIALTIQLNSVISSLFYYLVFTKNKENTNKINPDPYGSCQVL